jgi:hypothetical protein
MFYDEGYLFNLKKNLINSMMESSRQTLKEAFCDQNDGAFELVREHISTTLA